MKGLRKLIYAFITSCMVMICGALAAKSPAFAAQLPTIVGGLLGCLTIYVGGNLGDTHLASKAPVVSPTAVVPGSVGQPAPVSPADAPTGND